MTRQSGLAFLLVLALIGGGIAFGLWSGQARAPKEKSIPKRASGAPASAPSPASAPIPELEPKQEIAPAPEPAPELVPAPAPAPEAAAPPASAPSPPAPDEVAQSAAESDATQLDRSADGAAIFYRFGERVDASAEADLQLQGVLATGAEHELTSDFQAWQGELLALIDASLASESCQWPGLGDELDLKTELPFLSWSGRGVEAVLADAWRRSRDSNTLAALDRIADAFALARRIEGSGLVVASLMAASLRRKTMTQLHGMLEKEEDRDIFRRAIDQLARVEQDRMPMVATLASERVSMSNTIQGVLTGDEEMLKALASLGLKMPKMVDPVLYLEPQLVEFELMIDEMERQLLLPLPQAIGNLEQIQQRAVVASRQSPLLMFVPQAAVMAAKEADALGRLRGLRVWCAIRLHRLENGAWPESLDLVTSWLSGLPQDPLSPTGDPPRYARRGDTFSLYLVGRNMIDDHGDPALDLVIE